MNITINIMATRILSLLTLLSFVFFYACTGDSDGAVESNTVTVTGIIEDTVIFTALGANWWVLISCRFILAALAAFAVSFLVPVRPDAFKTN